MIQNSSRPICSNFNTDSNSEIRHYSSASFRRHLTAVDIQRHFDPSLIQQTALCRSRYVRVPDARGAARAGDRRRVEYGAVWGRRSRRVVELVAADVILLLDDAVAAAVRFGVLSEVIGARKALAAAGTREPLFAGVSSKVSLQFVAAGESFATEQPVADERAFPGVPAQVRLEVRRLAVDLSAAGHVAAVLHRLAEVLAGGAESVDFLAVGTGARRTTGGVAALTAGRAGRRRRLLDRWCCLPLPGDPGRAVVQVWVGLVRHETTKRRVSDRRILRQLDERRYAGLVERAEHRVVDSPCSRRRSQSARYGRRKGSR